MRRVVVFFIMFSMVGCSCPKRLTRLMERCPPPVEVDTVYSTLVLYRDTIIYRKIPGQIIRDTVKVPVEVEMPETNLKSVSALAEATAWIKDFELGLELIQYDSILEFKLDSAIRVSADTITMTETETVIKTVTEPPNPFWRNGFWVLVGIVVLGMILLLWFLKQK